MYAEVMSTIIIVMTDINAHINNCYKNGKHIISRKCNDVT